MHLYIVHIHAVHRLLFDYHHVHLSITVTFIDYMYTHTK